MAKTIRIGCGAGFQGDRLDPAVVLAARGKLCYLMLECLGERTVALAQLRKLHDPRHGYDSLLERRMGDLLPLIRENGVRVVTTRISGAAARRPGGRLNHRGGCPAWLPCRQASPIRR
jgi:hypothetical protein